MGLVTPPKLLNSQYIYKGEKAIVCETQDGEACSGCGLGHSDCYMESAREGSVDIAVSTLQYNGKRIQSVEQDDTA